jgi:hypothetical protein
VATFLLSWLSKHYASLDASIFLREQPGDWLLMQRSASGAPRAGEPLAVRIALRRDRDRFTLGRDPSSDVVVDAPGVELSHLVLSQDDDGCWTVRRAHDEVRARLDGLPLGDFPVALGSGARLEFGGVWLTYYAGADFFALLREAA